MSNSNNSGEKFFGFIIVGACIIAGMWLLEIGLFEKSYTPAPTYYNNYGGGSNLSDATYSHH